MKPQNNFFVLIVGVPKTGKTVSACTFPKPLLVLDYDDGLSSIHYTTDQHGKQIVTDIDSIYHIPFKVSGNVPFHTNTPDKQDFLNPKIPEYTKFSMELFTKYNTIMDELFKDQCVPSEMVGLPAGTRIGPFQTLIIDPISTLFRIWKEVIMNFNRIPALRIGDYQTLEGMLFGQFIPTLKSLKDKIPWIICIDHETIDKDALTGVLTEFPIGPSKDMGRCLGQAFCAILRSKCENGKYIWRTKPHGRFGSIGTRLHLPDNIEANYSEIEKYLKEFSKGTS